MRILAVDTSTLSCSVGILDDGWLRAETTGTKKQTHSRHLMQMIDLVIDMADIRLDEMDAFAVVTGPGSFTGIRIGVSTIQGFAMALSKPVVGVSSLNALAHQAMPSHGLICPLMDARKGEVYAALYRFEKETLQQVMGDRVISPEDLIARLDAPCLFIGNGVTIHRKVIQRKLGANALFARTGMNTIRAETVGRIAAQQIVTRDMESPSLLIPHYIRKSDAEIAAKTYERAQN